VASVQAIPHFSLCWVGG